MLSCGKPMIFYWEYFGHAMGRPWERHRNTVPMAFPWRAQGLKTACERHRNSVPMAFPWRSHGVPKAFPEGNPWFFLTLASLRKSLVFHRISLVFHGKTLVFLWKSLVFLKEIFGLPKENLISLGNHLFS